MPIDDDPEVWIPLAEFPGFAVSDRGRVVRLVEEGRLVRRLLRPRIESNGFLTVWVVDADGWRRGVTVHGLVSDAFHGPCPDGTFIEHVNGVRSDNRPQNLDFRPNDGFYAFGASAPFAGRDVHSN